MAEPFSGGRVVRGVALCVALTGLVPPAGAWLLADWRVARAASVAASTATMLGRRSAELALVAGDAGVLTGPGRLPRATDDGLGWVQNPVDASATAIGNWPTDPWGRCYLVNVGALFGRGSGLMISAGPNGEIETPLDAHSARGDDVVARVR